MVKTEAQTQPGPQAYAMISGGESRRRVQISRDLKASIQAVWSAITDPDEIRVWFAVTQISGGEGADIRMTFEGGEIVQGRVKIVLPPNVFSYTWVEADGSTSLVQYDLIELDEQVTRLTIVQTALKKADGPAVATGWHHMLDRLHSYLVDGKPIAQDARLEHLLYVHYSGLN